MKNVERRYFTIDELRVEAGDDTREPRLRGHAIVFGEESADLGGFTEAVDRGALARTLAEAGNVHAFWSHDQGLVLGSTRGGKLVLATDERGLAFDLSARRLTEAQLDAVRDGDMQMSFGFRTRRDAWEERKGAPLLRTLLDIDLYEVSLVARPAYPQTDVALRSLEDWRAVSRPADTEAHPADTEAHPADTETRPNYNVHRAKIDLALM